MDPDFHLIEADLEGIEDFWGWAAKLDQYMRLRAEWQAWLAERGESE
jgi:hypothetical protein